MNGIKVLGTVLTVLLAVFAVASTALVQITPGILDGQWFKVNLSFKGYVIADDLETVLRKGAGSGTAYLRFAYSPNNSTYKITTCMQDYLSRDLWHKNDSASISIDDIYGATYPQVWDLSNVGLLFGNGIEYYYCWPTFYTNITVTAATLKNATIANVVCTLHANLTGGEEGRYATGSCTLNGSLIPAAKVVTKVPGGCQ
jgi:hypothetical protein